MFTTKKFHPLFFLLIVVSMFSFALSYTVYDEIDDSSVNGTLWGTSTSGDNSPTITENTDVLRVDTNDYGGSIEIASAYTLLLNESNIVYLNFTSLLSIETRGDSSGTANANISVFGTYIRTNALTSQTISPAVQDNSNWYLIRNSTNLSKFDYFDDGVYLGTFTPTNNELRFNTYADDQVSVSGRWTNSNATVSFVYYDSLFVNQTSPTEGTEYLLGEQFYLNGSAMSTPTNNLVNMSLYLDGVLNETKSLSGTTDSEGFLKTLGTQGTHNWSIEVCDDGGNCLSSGNKTIEGIKAIDGEVSYTSPVTEGLENTFTTNQTVASGVTITAAIFEYNGTNYTTTITYASSIYTISSTINAPLVDADTNLTFRFWVTLDGVITARTTYNQTIEALQFGVCGGISNDTILNMSLYDEETKSSISGDIDITMDLIEKSSGSLVDTISHGFTSVTYGAICFSPLASYSSYEYDAEIRYTSSGYTAEFYHIQKSDISANETLGLYPLNSSSSTEFKITYQDSTYNFVEGAILQLQRGYTSEGTYETVEAPITSSDGTATFHIDLDAVKYRVTVVKDGEILDTFLNENFQCESELTGECTKKLLGSIDPQNDVNYETLEDFSYAITFGNSSITLVYSVPSSSPATVRIEMDQLDQFGNETLCNQTITSSAGSLECGYNVALGDSYLELRIYKDGEAKGIHTYLVPEANGVDWLDNNYIIIVILLLSLVGMALTSPEWMILNAIITLVLSGLLFLANGLNFVMGLGITMWLVIAAIILIFKISHQEDR